MAKRECISACIQVEESVATVVAFLDTVSEAAGDFPPPWLAVMYVFIGSVQRELAVLSDEVRS